MGHWIEAQRDFVAFVSLFAFIICALECVVLNREETGRRWLSSLSFFLFQSIAVLWILVSPILPAGSRSALLAPFLQSLSFGSLFAFGPGLTAHVRKKLKMVAVSLALVAVCVVMGFFLGAAPSSALTSLLLTVPGTLLLVRFLLQAPAVRSRKMPWLTAYAWTFAVFGFLMLLGSAGEMFFPRRLDSAFLALRVCVSLALAVTLSVHEWRTFARMNRGYGRPLTRLVIFGSFLALPVLLVLGGDVTFGLGQQAENTLRSQYSALADNVRNTIAAQTGEIDRDVSILSNAPPLGQLLAQGEGARIASLDVLDRYALVLLGSCYLLDVKGNVIASSAGSPGSFIQMPHAEAPWFKAALGGGAGRVFIVDRPTDVRGYYASAPVWEPTQGIVGVAVIVKNIVSLFPPISPDQDAFLINEYGVIFFCNAPDLIYRVLWLLPLANQNAIISSHEFGLIYFAPLFDAKPSDGELVSWAGTTYMASRSFLSIPGWSVVHLGSTREILLYRLAGLLATLIVTLVIAIFSAVGQMSLLDEARIERSEFFYRALIEGSPNWLSIVDTAGVFTFTNRAGRERFGITSADGSIEKLLGPDHVAEIAGSVQFALQGGVVSFEKVLPSASGDAKVWLITLVPLRVAGEEPTAILIGDDITEMRIAEARLVRAERMAALGTLAAGVAHQFNNINAVAMGYLQVLEAEPDSSQKSKRYLASVRRALERSALITDRLLPLSASPDEEPRLLLEDAVRAALSTVHPDLEREGVTVELKLERGAAVSINAEQLAFVVEALLVNAWHATLGQEVRHVLVSTGIKDAEAFLQVQDTGIGIPPDKLSSIFTPFYTEKGEHAPPQSPQARVRGVGLSLAVAHTMVTARDGRIELASKPGEGSRFTVWLPHT